MLTIFESLIATNFKSSQSIIQIQLAKHLLIECHHGCEGNKRELEMNCKTQNKTKQNYCHADVAL